MTAMILPKSSVSSRLIHAIRRRVRTAWTSLVFRVWRWNSILRFGDIRAVRYRQREFYVLSDDWRAYWLSVSDDVNPETRLKLEALLDIGPDLFVDVGANYGEFVAEALERRIRTVAIEPNERVTACLRKTFGGVGELMLVSAAAGSKAESSASLAVKQGLSGYSSLTESIVASKAGPARLSSPIELIPVKIRTLSEIMRDMPATAGGVVIKVDVEGHELEVLRGAKEWLDHYEGWWAILVEFDPRFMESRQLSPSRAFEELQAIAPCFGELVEGKLRWAPSSEANFPKRHTDLVLGSFHHLANAISV